MFPELEQVDQLSSVSVPVFFRTRTRSGEEVLSPKLLRFLEEHIRENLAGKIGLLRRYAPDLSKIDPCTERITNSLRHYKNGVIFEPLENGSLHIDNGDYTLSLNLEFVVKMVETVPKQFPLDAPQQWIRMACLVFVLHETSHIAQKLTKHQDVQRMKKVDVSVGRERMGELDMRSDFLAVHTLSLLQMFHEEKTYNHRKYIKWFYEIWCGVCRAMLDIFPSNNRKDKQQRIFGYLLISKLIRDAHLSNYPLEFNGELWPEWNASLDCLSIRSQCEPFISGNPVDSELMTQILEDISAGGYDNALPKIDELWRSLPRR